MIKTSKHSLKFTNRQKLDSLSTLLNEYRKYSKKLVDFIWFGNIPGFNPKNNEYKLPLFLNKTDLINFNPETNLTARCIQNASKQCLGMLKSSTEKQRKRLYVLNKQKSKGVSKKKLKQLNKKIKQNIPQKPNTDNIKIELNANCISFNRSDNHFDGFVVLSSIFKTKEKISIPIKYTKHSNNLSNKLNSKLMKSFLVSDDYIDFRYNFDPEPKKDTQTETVGADQGFKEVLTLSDRQITQKTDIHGHSLESILKKMSSKKRGSKSFKRSQNQRTNFINWSINQLNFNNIKQLNLEKIWNISYKSKSSRILSHWTNTLIRDKVIDKCNESNVLIKHISCTYNSQRCSNCGIVRKANRKGKIYKCKHCNLEIDSDYNASINLSLNLPEIPWTLRKLDKNRGTGFYWLKTGFFNYLTGTSL